MLAAYVHAVPMWQYLWSNGILNTVFAHKAAQQQQWKAADQRPPLWALHDFDSCRDEGQRPESRVQFYT